MCWFLEIDEIRQETQEEINKTEALNLEKMKAASKLTEQLLVLHKNGNWEANLQGYFYFHFCLFKFYSVNANLEVMIGPHLETMRSDIFINLVPAIQ